MNNIKQQFIIQFPEIYPVGLNNDHYATYTVLQHFGNYCANHFEDEMGKEILNSVSALYDQNNFFNCNAIENEFLFPLAEQLGLNNIMKHLQNIPEKLWPVYIKVLIETQKHI